MSEHHVEPQMPPADEVATRLFVVSIAGVLAFIAIVFIFIL
ncbi:MAG: hypothetical protein R3F35_12365 [Myxococcota bacterium]